MNLTELVYRVAKGVPKMLGSSPRTALAVGVSLSLLAICPLLFASEPDDVMRVEEDWEVVLNEPEAALNAPQFHTVCAPFSSLRCFYMQVCWNYRDQTEFAPGGMQLIAWLGDWCVGRRNYREDALSTAAETVTWTQAIDTDGSVLTFEIVNGSSQTWGDFGGAETRIAGQVDIANLNGYSTDFSVSNSWISYGANRVNLLWIKEDRRYDAAGNLLSRDQTPRVVFELH